MRIPDTSLFDAKANRAKVSFHTPKTVINDMLGVLERGDDGVKRSVSSLQPRKEVASDGRVSDGGVSCGNPIEKLGIQMGGMSSADNCGSTRF